MAIVGCAALLFLAFRPRFPGRQDLIPRGWLVSLSFLAVAAILVRVLWTIRGSGRRVGGAILMSVGVMAAVVATGMASTRIAILQHERSSPDVWPPRVDSARAVVLGELSGELQASWGLWLALASASRDPSRWSQPSIPERWGFPPGVRIGGIVTDSGAMLVAQSADGITCTALTWSDSSGWPTASVVPTCGDSPPAGVELAAPLRETDEPRRHEFPAPSRDPRTWPQYRRDAAHLIATPLSGDSASGWAAETRTPVRASASTAGGLVLVGGHGTGVLVALDASTGALRWRARLPNWIHQDPVSDGYRVLVGFGDKDASFLGQAPSGVAAFDLATGRWLWTAFDETSVMTSPVLHDSTAYSISAAGVLRGRSLADGSLRLERQLPGGAIMGPAALSGETLFVGLDVDVACAVLLPGGHELWCREFPGLRWMGHASPSVADSVVLLTGVATALTPGISEYRRLPWRNRLQQLRALLFPKYWDVNSPGQVILGVDRGTGATRWRSRVYPWARDVDGHTAGTAVVASGIGVVVLPMADVAVGFDITTGAERWSQPAHGSRGPVLVLDGSVVVAGQDGVVLVLNLATGSERCRLQSPLGFDRAGPVPTGVHAVFVRLDGRVVAVPREDLLACRGGLLR